MSNNEKKLRKEFDVKSFISPSDTVSKEVLINIISVLMDRIDALEANTVKKYKHVGDWDSDRKPGDLYGEERGLTPDDR